MDVQTIKEIERYFFDYGMRKLFVTEQELEILESNLITNYEHAGKSNVISDPTADKATQLLSLNELNWYNLIDSVFNSYKHLRPDIYEVMCDKYIKGKSSREICERIHRNTLSAWRYNWLTIAFEIATEKGIIGNKNASAQQNCAKRY